MSKFSKFMKANKKVRENGRYAPTESLLDEEGNPLEWEIRHISSKEHEVIRDDCTMEVQVKGKPNVYRQKFNTSKYIAKMIVASAVCLDLYDTDFTFEDFKMLEKFVNLNGFLTKFREEGIILEKVIEEEMIQRAWKRAQDKTGTPESSEWRLTSSRFTDIIFITKNLPLMCGRWSYIVSS